MSVVPDWSKICFFGFLDTANREFSQHGVILAGNHLPLRLAAGTKCCSLLFHPLVNHRELISSDELKGS